MGKHQRLLGEFIGTLNGMIAWDIPEKLKAILEAKAKKLEKEKPSTEEGCD